MAIEKAPSSISEQLSKLQERRAQIVADATSKQAEIDAEIAKLKEGALAEKYAKLYDVLNEIKGFGEQVWDIGNKAVAHLGLPVLGRGKKARITRMPKAEGVRSTRTSDPDKICPICSFKTAPPHDGRKHRGQAEKRPFTDAELHEMGMVKA